MSANERTKPSYLKVPVDDGLLRLLKIYGLCSHSGDSVEKIASDILSDFLVSRWKSFYASLKSSLGLGPDSDCSGIGGD